MSSRIDEAVKVAVFAHYGQKDKSGQPYVFHVLRVGLAGKTEDEQIVGFCHDVLEDSNFPAAAIQALFGVTIREAVESVSRLDKSESYMDFIKRCSKNLIGREVKILDLLDNSFRLGNLPRDERIRLDEKYAEALTYLYQERAKHGTSNPS